MNAPRKCYHLRKASIDGFTILEMLVSMAVFMLLGLALAVFMNASVQSYSVNSARRDAMSNAMAILGQIEADLVHAFLASGDRNPDTDIRFESKPDNSGTSRLVFVAQSTNPLTRTRDRGLREIAWYSEGAEKAPFKLKRTERFEIGGAGSLFSNIQGDTYATSATFSDMVGYFSVRFFPDLGSLTDERHNVSDANLQAGFTTWDSTRGRIPEFPLTIAGSFENPWDDILPERMRVTLTVIPREGMRAFLMNEIGDGDTVLKVNTTDGFPPPGNDIESFVVIDNEWMQVIAIDAETITVARAARDTIATAHRSDAEVRAGYSFMRTIFIPCRGKALR